MMFVIIFVAMFCAPAPAFAYFDPGTGSLLIQALVGSVAFLAMFWRQFKAYVSRLFSWNTNNSPSGEQNTATDGPKDTDTQDEAKP